MLQINGEVVDCSGMTLADYLVSAGCQAGRVAVERNGDIVPRSQYGETVLQDGDVLEVVRFVGGG